MDASLDSARGATRIAALLAYGDAVLAAAGVGTPRLDAELLLAAASGLDRTRLYTCGGERLSDQCAAAFRRLLARRIRREPLQYIVGCQEFWSLDFAVTADVLIPRPETELLVELALGVVEYDPSRRRQKKAAPQGERMNALGSESNDFSTVRGEALEAHSALLPAAARVCDVGTGSGCVAVALAHELPTAEIWVLDVSTAALGVAASNAQRHGVAARVRCVHSDLFTAVPGERFDVIVSNPPYLSAEDMADLQPEIGFEPRVALDGGAGGLDIIERLVMQAPHHLVGGGWLLMEIGATQAAEVECLAHAAGFAAVAIRPDYAGLPRVLMAQR